MWYNEEGDKDVATLKFLFVCCHPTNQWSTVAQLEESLTGYRRVASLRLTTGRVTVAVCCVLEQDNEDILSGA